MDNVEFNTSAQNTLGALTNQADTAVLKRLVFEGHTLVLGQLRELVTDPNAAASRKLPAVEREHRMTQLKQRLNGVVIECQLGPCSRRSQTNWSTFSWRDALPVNGRLQWGRARNSHPLILKSLW